jgi:hypothetical protein
MFHPTIESIPEDIFISNVLNEDDDFDPDDLGDEDDDLEDSIWNEDDDFDPDDDD